VSVPRDGDAHGPVDTHSGRVVPARIDLGQDDVSVLTVAGTVMMQAKLFTDSVDRPSVLDREVARKRKLVTHAVLLEHQGSGKDVEDDGVVKVDIVVPGLRASVRKVTRHRRLVLGEAAVRV
jgi:hypothetical protein